MGVTFEYKSLGRKMDPELRKRIPEVLDACDKCNLDPFPLVIQTYNAYEIAEIAAYGGFPVRYPHFSFGQQYEELSNQYRYGFGKIYEMVINNNPTYMYLQQNNPLVDNLTVVAHATAHSDFFKVNKTFEKTNRNMINIMADHGNMIRRYMEMFGRQEVSDFLNSCLIIDDLIDPWFAWRKVSGLGDSTEKFVHKIERPHVERLPSPDYMDKFINTPEYIEREKEKIRAKQEEIKTRFPLKPERDILYFLINNAPLNMWQQNILSMVRNEALYFAPQMMTKVMNEGWAATWDSHIMATCGFAGDEGIVDYAKHHAGVLGGQYNVSNPYKLGSELFRSIRERWDKGQFGEEWERCDNLSEKEKWNKKLGLGLDKIFEVRELYNDVTFINEFFTKEFCHEYKFFEYQLNPETKKYVVVSKDHNKIKNKFLQRFINGGRPIITLVNSKHKKTEILLHHEFDGRTLDISYAEKVLPHLYKMFKRPINIETKLIIDVEKGTTRNAVHRYNGDQLEIDVK